MRKIPVALIFLVALILALIYLILIGTLTALILIPAQQFTKLAEWVSK
jgi:energy-converting hydrogenase Eha subunit E